MNDFPVPPLSAIPTHLPLTGWLREGLRAAWFLPPRTAGREPSASQVLCIVVAFFVLELALGRLEISGAARFDAQAWLSSWWVLLVFVGMACWAFPLRPGLPESPRSSRVSACFVLWLLASVPASIAYQLVLLGAMHGWLSARTAQTPWFYWTLYGVFLLWTYGVTTLLIRRFSGWTWRTAVFVLVLLACNALTVSQFNVRTWQDDPDRSASAEAAKPRLRLTQQAFENQQGLMQGTLAAIAAEQPGVVDVYGLVFAPYAPEDVFIRESTLVKQVLVDRFDAAGRVVHLLNHGATAETHPWASALNLQRAIDALARRMNRQEDVLVVYLTSHGASDFKLAASHWPLELEPISPATLRQALDNAGIRNRVIAVSACYSGGWVDVLATDHTLVMTAADATHTSYGCGRLSELTFFGRALFDEQLRKTHSFEQAFAAAVPDIRQREIDAGKDDGFSNPQIRVGTGIRPTLLSLQGRLEQMVSSRAPLSAASASAPK